MENSIVITQQPVALTPSTAQNLASAGKDLVKACTEVLTVTAQVTADTASFTAKAVKDVVPTTKAVLSLPMTAASQYLQDDGVSKIDADARAFRVVNQPLSSTINGASASLGSLAHKAKAAMA